MLKELFDKGKCALGFHTGDWRYVKDQQCEQVQVCSRCKAENRQVVHIWQAWQYLSSKSCEMIRKCGRCRQEENKVEHAWAAPVYEAPGSCVQVRPCSRCREKSSAGVTHTWDSWSYEIHGQCTQVSTCSRCRANGMQKRISHNWGDWYKSQFYAAPVRVCRRCGEMIFALDHPKSEKESVSLQTVQRAVEDIMQATGVDGVREQITRYSTVLFSPVTEKYFNFAVDQLAATAEAKDTYLKLAGVIDRCRREGVDSVFRPIPSGTAAVTSGASNDARAQTFVKTDANIDQRLIGHWRHTEILGSGGLTMTIDTHCILDATGRMQWYSRTASGTDGPESGVWSASNDTLNLMFDKGDRLAFAYVLEGSTMFCPREGRYRFWERIN
jgi:hypothetical protein